MIRVLDVITGQTTVPFSCSYSDENKKDTDIVVTRSRNDECNNWRLYTLDTECKACPIDCLVISVPCIPTYFFNSYYRML